jgi:hypothetical protein
MVRLLLGIAQMFGATVSGVLLVETGLSSLTLWGVIVTSVLTTVSVLLFGWRGKEKNH